MSTMSDVLPSSNQEALPPGPTVPPKNQAAIERLRKRMEGYREMQNSRLPEYEQTMNHMNSQQMQETLALRQKFLESKAKKPNKKSSSSVGGGSGDKMKHDMSSTAPSNMNGIMQFHPPPPSHNGPPMVPNMNGPGLGVNGPMQHQNGPGSMMNHGPPGGPPSHNKRPLEDDSSNIQSETAKRLNLDNGNISDQNFIKREPSPLETKFNPGGGNYGAPAQGPPSQSSPGPDIKPNVKDLAGGLSQSESKAQLPDRSETKEDFKAEVSDSLKQEDTLGDLDLKDFDFDGMNADSLQDLMDDLPENFIDDFDFENSKIASDDKESENISNSETSGENGQHSTAPPCHSSSSSSSTSSTSQPVSVTSGTAGTPAAETLKMMAQQHQQPPSSQPGPFPTGGPGPGMHPNSSMPAGYQPPPSAMTSGGPPASSLPNNPETPANMMGGPGGPRMQGPQDGDPRLRAAASQRFRLGNPNSIANNMGSTGPGMMPNQRVAQMGNNNMMGNMAGNQPGMGGNMQMMNQQQVSPTGHRNVCRHYNYISRCTRVTQAWAR